MPAPQARSAVDKALDLIEVVARSDRPLRLSEVAGEVGLHRATAYRVLLELVQRGWVLRVGDRYLPGIVVLQLSGPATANSLIAVARPVLETLSARTGMMVNLQVLESDRSRVIDVIRPARLEMITDLREELLPVHRFAGPLALVALLEPAARQPYLRLAEQAGYPLAGPDGLLAEIEQARQAGYALERGRNDKLIASVAQGVPSPKGPPVCALTLVGPDAEFDQPTLRTMLSGLAEAVGELQQALAGLGAGTELPAPPDRPGDPR